MGMLVENADRENGLDIEKNKDGVTLSKEDPGFISPHQRDFTA